MTIQTQLYFSAFFIISFELMLMMYIFMLQPKLRSNRLFAVYMLILSASSFSVFVASISEDIASVFAAMQVHALATMASSPLLWLLVFAVFIPQHRLTRLAWGPLLLLAALPLVVHLLALVTAVPLLIVPDLDLYTQGFISIRQVLNGRLGSLFFTVYVTLLNSLLVLPISIFAFSRMLPNRQRHAARVLFLFTLSVVVLYLPWLDISFALRNMLTPVFAAVGAAWVMQRYRVFSPMALAMKQVVDTVTIGLLVFDEQLRLLDANAFAIELLPIQLSEDTETLTVPGLLDRLLAQVENREELRQLQTAVQARPNNVYQQEIVLQNGRTQDGIDKTWLSLNIRPVYDKKQQFWGCSCTVEDMTLERRTQAYITEAHKAIEHYAYNQSLLNEITQAAISTSNFDEYLHTLASRLVGLFEADHCYISLWDKVNQEPLAAVAYGEGTEAYLTIPRGPQDFTLSRKVYSMGKALPIEDIYQSPHVSQRVARSIPTRGLLALPMETNDEAVGALLIGFKEPRQFSPEEVKWGEQIAQQLTLAISKNQLLSTEREQRVLLEALQEAGQALIGTLDFEQVLDRILEEIARVVPYDTANFALIRGNAAVIVRKRDFGNFETKQSAPYLLGVDTLKIAALPTLQKMYKTKRPLRISNTDQSEYWSYGGHIKSWMGVPIIFGDEPVAFLMVDKVEPDFYKAQHEHGLIAFANQATLALKHAQLFTEIQRRVTELEALSSVSAALRSSDTVPNILQSVLQAMAQVLSARVGVGFLLNEAETAVVSQASFPPHFYPKGIAFALGEGITGHVAQTGQLYTSMDIHQDPLYADRSDDPDEIQSVRATIALPLISEDRILGVIHLGLATQHQFADDEIRSLKAMCDIVANGLQRIQLMQTLEARVTNRTFDLEMANERLQELDKLKTKFIADVSHELRTPVANLSIYINLLENGNPQKQAHYIGILQQQVNRLASLVEATLGLSQLEMDPKSQQFSPVALNPIIDEVLLGHQARADAFGITLTRALQPNLPLLLGNKTQLVQLITNLVTNGIHYNEKQGEIIVETFVSEQNQLCLRVADNGMGIDPQELPHLFDRFYRGQRTGQSNIPGTGLGLAIVKEIVELHKGQISVMSQLDEGTVFSVFFPIYQPETFVNEVEERV